MKIAVSEDARKQAKKPHDLYMTNMFLFNIPMIALTLAFTIGGNPILMWAVIGCMVVSLGIIGYIRLQSKNYNLENHWFQAMHYQISMKRAKLVVIGYISAIVIIGAGILISSTIKDANMQTIMVTVFTRIGIVPALLLILVTTILEGQAMHMVNNGIVPDKLAKTSPPGNDVEIVDSTSE